MTINFYKYQATGNDFIIIDSRGGDYVFTKENISSLCDRKYGVGSDGLMLIMDNDEVDFEMQFYNPDGSMSFCGNGSRCAVSFCYHNGIISKECVFLTNDGVHKARILDYNLVKIDVLGPIKIKSLPNGDFQTDTGSPHYVKFTDHLEDPDLMKECQLIRYSEAYKKDGINVNMVMPNENGLEMRTYERGVEGETLSCGSGVTAAALCYSLLYEKFNNEVSVRTQGGDLNVSFEFINNHFNDVSLTGPAVFVFRGEISL